MMNNLKLKVSLRSVFIALTIVGVYLAGVLSGRHAERKRTDAVMNQKALEYAEAGVFLSDATQRLLSLQKELKKTLHDLSPGDAKEYSRALSDFDKSLDEFNLPAPLP